VSHASWPDLLANRPGDGRVRGRLAPSPTGELHLGNAQSALGAWLSVRQQGGLLLWRTEDLDRARVIPGCAERCREDLHWLGLDWDEEPGAPYTQSLRAAVYRAALEELDHRGRLYACTLSRKELESLASAPLPAEYTGERPFPRELRPGSLPAPGMASRSGSPGANLRFLCEDRMEHWQDRVLGPGSGNALVQCGDFVLRRRDGVFAYQLAVVVDDILMGITEVVRGADLAESVSRQCQLFRALGADPPEFAHLPLLLSATGHKLGKRDGALGLGELRRAGVDPRRLTGWLGWSLGLLPRPLPCLPADLLEHLDWRALARTPRRVPSDLARELGS
jgi:glutamyl-tRNA synthetase